MLHCRMSNTDALSSQSCEEDTQPQTNEQTIDVGFKLLPISGATAKTATTVKPTATSSKSVPDIPLYSDHTEKRMDKLEALILAQHQQTQQMQLALNALLGQKAQPDIVVDEQEEEEFGDYPTEEGEIVEKEAPEETEQQESPEHDAGFAQKYLDIKTGPPIHDTVAKGLNYVLRHPISQEALKNIEKLNKTPSNCPGLMTPSCNTTIFAGVSKLSRKVDRAMQEFTMTS